MTLDQVPADIMVNSGYVKSDLENEIIHPFKEKVSELLGCCQMVTERLNRLRGSSDYQTKVEMLENENFALRMRCSELEGMVEELQQKKCFPGLTEFERRQIDEQLMRNRLTADKLELQNNQLEDKFQQTRKQLEEAKNQLELLSVQLLIYKEDFDSERKDREKTQGRVVDLEQQLKNMHVFQQQQQIPYKVTIPASATFNFRQYSNSPLPHRHHDPYPMSEFTARGYDVCDIYETDGATEANRSEVVDSNLDSLVTSTGNNLKLEPQETMGLTLVADGCPDTIPVKNNKCGSQVLHCTNCHKPFPLEDHMLLLDHLEECNV